MYRSFFAEKDTYITDRVISGQRANGANVGRAGTLDIFKLYGVTSSGSFPNNELSRALIKFDLSDIRTHLQSVGLTGGSSGVSFTLKLFDVYSSQTTPANFSLVAYPLSRSFDEGTGRDVAYYRDRDSANFLTASWNGSANVWFLSGANRLGLLGSSDIDVISSGNIGAGTTQFGVSQSFSLGTEDLTLDVTPIISATLANLIPDCGFRISFVQSQEQDTRSRFVKRFGSRSVSDPAKRPRLVMSWDDSITDDREHMTLDVSGTFRLYNHTVSGLKNFVSGAALTPLVGQNCMLLRFETPISGGIYSASFLASQYTFGSVAKSGSYYASVSIPSSATGLAEQLAVSGTITFTEIWSSLDRTVAFMSQSITLGRQDAQTFGILPIQHVVNFVNMKGSYTTNEVPLLRAFIKKIGESQKATRVTRLAKSHVPQAVHYRVKDSVTGDIYIEFDESGGSTKMSCDSLGATFALYMNTLASGRSYTLDVMIVEGDERTVYPAVCQPFRVEEPS